MGLLNKVASRIATVFDGSQWRLFGFAAIDCDRTAGVKSTAGRRIDRCGNVAS